MSNFTVFLHAAGRFGKLLCWASLSAVILLTPAAAQYNYNSNNEDEQKPGIKYFGSAKDDRGALLESVALVFGENYFIQTDNQGRFHVFLPLEMTPDKVNVRCVKNGYSVASLTKRPGPKGLRATVEVNCVLHKAN